MSTTQPRTLTALAAVTLLAAAVAGCGGAAATPSQKNSGTPSAATAAGVKIQYEENAQVELTGPTGRRVLIDVWNTAALSKPPTADDVLLTTHTHGDHYVPTFVDAFPGQKLTFETGQIKLSDVTVTGIAAAHDEGDEMIAEGGTDYIFLIELGGLRIGHFGDLGQDKLTSEQMTALGKVDVAISQLSNSFSDMDETNRKGFNQMAQVAPRLLIPTHVNLATARLATTQWKPLYTDKPAITISAAGLPAEPTVLFMGNQASNFAAAFTISAATW